MSVHTAEGNDVEFVGREIGLNGMENLDGRRKIQKPKSDTAICREKIFDAEKLIHQTLFFRHRQTPITSSNTGEFVATFRGNSQSDLRKLFMEKGGVANGTRTRNNKLHKLGLYH